MGISEGSQSLLSEMGREIGGLNDQIGTSGSDDPF